MSNYKNNKKQDILCLSVQLNQDFYLNLRKNIIMTFFEGDDCLSC